MPNIYVNLKKRIEISHLRDSSNVYSQVIYFTAIQQVVDEYYSQKIQIIEPFSNLLIQFIATQQGIL